MGISTTGLSGKVVDDVFFFILGICVFLLALITFLIVYFVIRYRKEKNPRPTDIEGNAWLEITWTIAPTLLVLAMFYYGLTGFEFLRKVPQGAMVVNVIARQWSWLFDYGNGIQTPQLRVPVGKPVKLLITSKDVIHSFYLPAFRIKQDAVPGMQTYLWFQATQVGTFDVLCAQYCGLGHANMQTKLIVMPEKEFASWYQKKQIEMVAAKKGPSLGLQLYQEKGCIGCHSLDGRAGVGPTWKDLYGSKVEVTTAGKERTVVADETYIRRSIEDPNADIVVGYSANIMPKLHLTPAQVTALVEFIESQSEKGEAQETVSSGARLYEAKGCVGCHSTDGSPRVGPTFKGLFGRSEEVIKEGKETKVVVDESFIRNYIGNPNVIRIKGYPPIMPKISMTRKERGALVDYIKSLK